MSEIERLTKLLAEAATKGRHDLEEITSLKKSLAEMTAAKSAADRTIADWEIQVSATAIIPLLLCKAHSPMHLLTRADTYFTNAHTRTHPFLHVLSSTLSYTL